MSTLIFSLLCPFWQPCWTVDHRLNYGTCIVSYELIIWWLQTYHLDAAEHDFHVKGNCFRRELTVTEMKVQASNKSSNNTSQWYSAIWSKSQLLSNAQRPREPAYLFTQSLDFHRKADNKLALSLGCKTTQNLCNISCQRNTGRWFALVSSVC